MADSIKVGVHLRNLIQRFCQLLLSSGSNFCRDLADSRQLLSSAKNLLPSRYANFDLQVPGEASDVTNSIASRQVRTQMSTEPVEPDISLHPIVVDVNEIKTSLETSILKGGGGCVGEEQDAEETPNFCGFTNDQETSVGCYRQSTAECQSLQFQHSRTFSRRCFMCPFRPVIRLMRK